MSDRFVDRADAGRRLAVEVAERLGQPEAADRPLVLALPRGGVPVAAEVARAVDGDLDVVVARKIGAPGHPEFGVGALAEDGPPVLDRRSLERLGLAEADLVATIDRERAELHRRADRYRAGRPAPAVADRVVVLVDDGLATGVTARAAMRWLRGHRPRRLLLAVPTCAERAMADVGAEADEVVCLFAPRPFQAVGRWYADFRQVSDNDVERVLDRYRPSRRTWRR